MPDGLSHAQRRFTLLLADLITWAYDQGYELTLGDAYRSPEEAKRLAALGLGIEDSPHRRRLAIDLNLFVDGRYMTDTKDWEPLGVYWESLDPKCVWGGRFKSRPDGNHLELKWP
jgi:hypothetical protein